MAGLKEIRLRIASVSSTKQITNAMKMVSAAKLRKAQNAITKIRPYAEKLHEILANLSESLDTTTENIYAQQREQEKILIIVLSSNRGLCGAFNTNAIKKAIQQTTEQYKEQFENGDIEFLAIGKKAAEILGNKDYNIIGEYHELYDSLDFQNAAKVAESVMQYFVGNEYDHVELIYNQFKNAAVQVLTVEQFLPIKIKESTDKNSYFRDYIFEPSKEYIVQNLIPSSLKIQFYKALLDSHAAEHGARMTAMHKATDNATQLIKDLKLTYNKARQAAITKEILEIVGGAEALKG